MRNIIYILLSLFVLTSCVKYSEPTSLSLSGLYVIDEIVTNSNTYNVGDTLFDIHDIILPTPDTTSYIVGDTLFEMDYSSIRFNPIQGGLHWGNVYFYTVRNHHTTYDLGYINFSCEGTARNWKIIDDGAESLVIRTMPNEFGEYMVISLTRIGP